MTFAEWCAQPFADGRHRFTSLPLPALHPLLHGQFEVAFELRDQRISECAFTVTGSHRADEKLLELRDPKQGLALVNRHGWLTAAFAETLYARIIERALGLQISERAAALRQLVMALNAAATEAYWSTISQLLEGASAGLDARERILDVMERITGARMHSTYVRIGGVAADIDDGDVAAVRALHLDDVDRALDRALGCRGDIAVQLPKVLRIPYGDYYDEITTPHGTMGIWIFAKGDKVPHRVQLRTAGMLSLAQLEREAIGMTAQEFLRRLAHTRLVLGEVAR